MHALLGFTAIAIAAAAFPDPMFAADSQAFVGRPAPSFHRDFGIVSGSHDGDFRRNRGGFGDDGSIFVYDRDWQGDSAWRSDSFNDWWHDQPARAYPRWMLNNQNCERRWWSGGGWRC